MAIRYAPDERAALDARARAMLAECPDVGSFIRRGLGRNSSGEAIVYLRTALDPAPVVTSADAFRGLLGSASRWLRRNGVGPARRRLAAGAELHRDFGRLLGGDEFGRRAAAQSAVHPRGDRRAGRRGRGQNSVRAAARARPAACSRRSRGCGRWRRASSASSCCRSTEPSPSTARRSCPTAARTRAGKAPRRPSRIASSRCCRPAEPPGAPKVVPLTNRNVVASAIASMLAGEFRAVDRIMVALPLFHVGGVVLRESSGSRRGRDFGHSDRRGISQSRGRRQLLAHRRGAAPDRRRAGPDRARRGRRPFRPPAPTSRDCGYFRPARRSVRQRSSGGS